MKGLESSLATVFGVKTHYEQGVRHKERERQRELYSKMSGRKNNRKNTRSRRAQYITWIDSSVWPPVIKHKCIKHDSL